MVERVRAGGKQINARVREKWGLLTDDDLEHIAGQQGPPVHLLIILAIVAFILHFVRGRSAP